MSPEGAAKTAATLAALKDIDDEEDDVEPRPNTRGDNLYSERVRLENLTKDHLG